MLLSLCIHALRLVSISYSRAIVRGVDSAPPPRLTRTLPIRLTQRTTLSAVVRAVLVLVGLSTISVLRLPTIARTLPMRLTQRKTRAWQWCGRGLGNRARDCAYTISQDYDLEARRESPRLQLHYQAQPRSTYTRWQ